MPTEAEQWFETYLDAHGYRYEHEPDYAATFGVTMEKKPDYLVERDGLRFVAEFKQFETWRITERLLKAGGTAWIPPTDVFGPIRRAMQSGAEELAPLAAAGVPLVVVLSNPMRADVELDPYHLQHAMFGNPKVQVFVGPEPVPDALPYAKDHGTFRSVVDEGSRVVNYHPHVSAVVTLHERTRHQDWAHAEAERLAQLAEREGRPLDASEFVEVMDAAEAEGRIPTGSYYWVTVYDLYVDQLEAFSGTRLPRGDVFNGPHDLWYGGLGSSDVGRGRYGQLH